jgi:hypothetical protein
VTKQLAKLVLHASHAEIRRVLALTWPGITQLVITVKRSRATTDFARLLDGSAFPNLAELVPALPPGVIEKLCTSPLAAQLRVLDLRSMVIDERLARKLIAARAQFVRLDALALDMTYLSPELRRRLAHSMPVT